MKENIKRTFIFAAIATIAIAGFLISRNEISWAAGLAISVLWSMLNFTLTVGLLETAILKRSGAKLTAILMVKFPVLYLAGFMILTRGWFPAMSLMAGISLAIMTIGAVYLWPKRT